MSVVTKIPEQLHIPPNINDATTRAWRREIQTKWLTMATRLNQILNLYYQDAEPVISENTFALWVDTNAGPKYYMIANFGGTQKKVEFV